MLVWVVAFFGFFRVLQYFSDKTCRPSPLKVKEILVAAIEGRLRPAAFDEFSCVTIAYDKRPDAIRARFNEIVEDKKYIEGGFTNGNTTPLDTAGKERLYGLVCELELLAAQQSVPADVARPAGERRG